MKKRLKVIDYHVKHIIFLLEYTQTRAWILTVLMMWYTDSVATGIIPILFIKSTFTLRTTKP